MIRLAQSEDAGAVAALWNWMIRDTLLTFTTHEKTTTAVADMIRDRSGRFFVCDDDGRVCGFATYGAFRSGPGYAATCEHSVLVDPHYHRGGVGRSLMDALIAAAEAEGMHVMVAAISSANPQAMSFHARLGFEQVGVMPQVGRKAGQWLDLIFMQKMLNLAP